MISEAYLRDCMDFMKQIPDNYFCLSVVDPPYGINAPMMSATPCQRKGGMQRLNGGGVKFKNRVLNTAKKIEWDYQIPSDEYFIELFRVSKNQIIWGGNYFIEHLKNTRCFIVWNKENGTNNMADCELAWASFETSVRMYSGHIFKGIGNSNYATIHPTQKPIKLYEWILDKYAKPNDLILDTHLGSGSSRIAAYKGGFNFVGFEIDQEYYEKQEKRFNDFKSQLRLF